MGERNVSLKEKLFRAGMAMAIVGTAAGCRGKSTEDIIATQENKPAITAPLPDNAYTLTPEITPTLAPTMTTTPEPTITVVPTETKLPVLSFGDELPIEIVSRDSYGEVKDFTIEYQSLPKITEEDIVSGAWARSIDSRFGGTVEVPKEIHLIKWFARDVGATLWGGASVSFMGSDEDMNFFVNDPGSDLSYPARTIPAYSWIENYRGTGRDVLVGAFRYFNPDGTSVVIPMVMDMQVGDSTGGDLKAFYIMAFRFNEIMENYGLYPLMMVNPIDGTDGVGSKTTVETTDQKRRDQLEFVFEHVVATGSIPPEASKIPWPFGWWR